MQNEKKYQFRRPLFTASQNLNFSLTIRIGCHTATDAHLIYRRSPAVLVPVQRTAPFNSANGLEI